MNEITHYQDLLQQYIGTHAKNMLCEPSGILRYPYIVPGSKFYSTMLWDWDSWLTDVALRQYALTDDAFAEQLPTYETGCLLNFAGHTLENGFMPIMIEKDGNSIFQSPAGDSWPNMHKPVFAQHAAFLVSQGFSLPELILDKALDFLSAYELHFRHAETGLFFWQDDCAIGVDNDPSTYFRPRRSSGSILLNSFLYREMLAVGFLLEDAGRMQEALSWKQKATALKKAVIEYCYDRRDGSFYSVDLNLLPNRNITGLHSGAPRSWSCLLMRFDVWSNILPLWAGLADSSQAEHVMLRFKDNRLFCAQYGIRTLSPLESMYDLSATNNPSNWLGPVWGVANYLTWRAMVKYGYLDDAVMLAEKTIRLLGRDLAATGTLHEYYHPDTGEAIMTPHFINWNALVLNMSAWLKGTKLISEF